MVFVLFRTLDGPDCTDLWRSSPRRRQLTLGAKAFTEGLDDFLNGRGSDVDRFADAQSFIWVQGSDEY